MGQDTEVALDQALFKTVKDWLNNEWPMAVRLVALVGRLGVSFKF